MARLPIAANSPDNKEGLEDFSPIPPGNPIAQIIQSEYHETKAKDGHYLQLRWKIVSGPSKGKTLIDRLNLKNKNPVAVEISNKALNSICKAAGKIGVEDSEELHGIPIKLTVALTPATATQGPSNNITGYAPVGPEDAVVDNTPSTPAGAAAAGPTTGKKLPWEK